MKRTVGDRTISHVARSIVIAAVLGVSAVSAHLARAQDQRSGDALEVLQVQPNFYMIGRAGGNIAVQIGPDGVVLVDSGSREMADAVVAAIKKLTDQPIRYIINTNPDADPSGGCARRRGHHVSGVSKETEGDLRRAREMRPLLLWMGRRRGKPRAGPDGLHQRRRAPINRVRPRQCVSSLSSA